MTQVLTVIKYKQVLRHYENILNAVVCKCSSYSTTKRSTKEMYVLRKLSYLLRTKMYYLKNFDTTYEINMNIIEMGSL